MGSNARLRIYTHHFVIDKVEPYLIPILGRFSVKNGAWGMVRTNNGRFQRTLVKVYAASSRKRSFFRYHINQFEEFKTHLAENGVTMASFDVQEMPVPDKVKKSGLKIKAGWTPKPEQLPAIAHLKKEGKPRSRLLELQTGKGKSFCFLQAAADIGDLAVFIIRPSYIPKWIIDIKKCCDIDPDRIISVEGSFELQCLLDRAKSPDFDPGVILISNRTFQNYLRLYDELEDGILDQGYACTPENFYEHLGAGIKCIDETHQDFHLNFRTDLYGNVKLAVGLTATLTSKEPILQKMYQVMFPPEARVDAGAYDKYIKAYAVGYRMKSPSMVRTTEWGSKNYSHTAFEKSILKNKELKRGYFGMIKRTIDRYHFSEQKEGNKLAIFCATIEMCEKLVQYLRDVYPELTTEKYTQGDSYDNLINPVIRVTTLGKAGAAVDIPGLKTTILTVSVDSVQSNLQVFGRTRKMSDGQIPKFVWLYCKQIKKQDEYSQSRAALLGPRSIELVEIDYGVTM